MENYTLYDEIGKGSFGSVFQATRKKDRKPVAIKILFQKYPDWTAARTMREFRAIVDLPNGSNNLCQIYDIIREKDGTLYFVMELMPSGSLKDYIESFWPPSSQLSEGSTCSVGTKRIDPSSIQSILRQVLQGLKYIHSKGYMHRDLKPENILMNGRVCKVTDFSLARTMASVPAEKKIQWDSQSSHHHDPRTGHHDQSQPQHAFCSHKKPSFYTLHNALRTKMTSYVATRWYRAPEIILCAPQYSCAVDIFALGCVMAELYRLIALLPGSGEIPQLVLICELWGGPLLWHQYWPEGKRLAEKLGLEVDKHGDCNKQAKNETHPGHYDPIESICLSKLRSEVPSACERALDLMENCLQMNPDARPTASKALQHDFFQPSKSPSCQISSITPSPVLPNIKTDVTDWRDSDALYWNGSPSPTSTTAVRNHVQYASWNKNAIQSSKSAFDATNMKRREMGQVIPSAVQSSDSCPVGFWSPYYNVGNSGLNSTIVSDKVSLLMRSIDNKTRHALDSITNSHRKKRGNSYKPARAFERKF